MATPSVPDETREWEMVKELYEECFDDLKDSEQEFIKKLYDNLDPYEPFLEQMEGLSGGKNQEKWLNSIYERVCNEDDEAAKEIYEDDD